MPTTALQQRPLDKNIFLTPFFLLPFSPKRHLSLTNLQAISILQAALAEAKANWKAARAKAAEVAAAAAALKPAAAATAGEAAAPSSPRPAAA